MKTVCFVALTFLAGIVVAQEEEEFTEDFRLQDCRFSSQGDNPYFILRPGRLVLESEEDGETVRVVITVLHETVGIMVPGVGVVRTRVVEERESVDDELVEVSRNFFAICGPSNDVFYFGEDVNIYEEDGSISHDGAWRAGNPDGDGLAKPGIIMPGRFLLGARYFQEQADGIAMDRAEHVEMGLTMRTRAGTFNDCVKIIETTPLSPDEESEKIYCRGVGLVFDSGAELISSTYKKSDEDDDSDD